jgi:organic radical activating enzyme
MAAFRLPLVPASPAWLEIALDFRCNLRCLGCHACHDTGESMSFAQADELLRAARARGVTGLWLGGGEPTLRDDLLALVRRARALGFERVLLQTNGMRLVYPAYVEAMLSAGVSEVSVNLKSHRAEVHDRLSRAACHAVLLQALDVLRAKSVIVSGDVLATQSTLPDLSALTTFYAARGVRRFVVWLLSAADDAGDREVEAEVPRIADLVPYLAGAVAAAEEARVELVTLHTPPCTLPVALRDRFSPASALGLVVAGPDGRTFALEDSSFEGGAYLDGCARCAERSRCGGPRADYLRIHGAAEFAPLLPGGAD